MKKILVIDDLEDNLLSLKALISDFFSGFSIYTATSGPEGIGLAKTHHPDVILLDILMPGMDGFEVCKILKEDESLRDIPVVFVTALKENKENKVHALEVGAEGFLCKPIDENELNAQVKAMLKIKAANDSKKSEKQRLEEMVSERTKELKEELRLNREMSRKLSESEEKYRRITDNITDVVFITDLTFNTSYISPSVRNLIGVSAEEYLTMSLDEKHPPSSLQQFQKILAREMQAEIAGTADKNRTIVIEGEHYKKDGSIIAISMHVSFIRDEMGNPMAIQGVTRDVTERKKAQKELINQQERLESIVKILQHKTTDVQEFLDFALNEAIALTESKIGYIFFYTGETKELTLNVWSKDVLPQCSIINPKTIYQLDKTGIWGEAVRQRKEIIVNDFHAPLPLKKGFPEGHASIHKFLTVPIFRNGQILAVVGVANKAEDYDQNDVLQLKILMDSVWKEVGAKQTERALRESEERFRVAQEMSPDGFTILHPVRNDKGEVVDFTWVYENRAVALTNGTVPKDVMGKRLLDLFPSHRGTTVFKAYLHVANTGKTQILEEVYVGEIISIPTWLRLVVVSMGEDIAILSQNITGRKQAEEQLKLLNRAVESSSVSVVIADAEGNIVYTNPWFTQITGYPKEEVFGRKLRILNTGKLSESDSEELWRAISSGNDWSGEYQNRRKNGEYYWEESVISPILSSTGELANVISINEDITERKKMIEDLVDTKEKAQESNRLKSAFLANISHEIRTPMNRILGFLELIQEPDLDEEEKADYINIVKKSGQRLLSTINDLIEISKIESGDMQVNRQEIRIQQFLSYYYDFFSPQANEKGLHLKLVRYKAAPETIFTDKSKFNSILNNLIKNAIKFTEKGCIEFGCEQKDKNNLLFYVKDTGKGIHPEKIDLIFERFMQEEISLTRGYEGSGLGLSITKTYIEVLGGKIWVESEPGKGSCFYFTIPCAGSN